MVYCCVSALELAYALSELSRAAKGVDLRQLDYLTGYVASLILYINYDVGRLRTLMSIIIFMT